MFCFGSATITWSSKKQPRVALSSTKGEYQGAIVATCEVAWICKLFADLCVMIPHKILIHYDNLRIIQLA